MSDLITTMRQLQNDLIEDKENVKDDFTRRPVLHFIMQTVWHATSEEYADTLRGAYLPQPHARKPH